MHSHRLKRREFMTLLGSAAVTWSLAARAQQAGGMRRIGVLIPAPSDDQEYQARLAAFLRGLQQLGWTDGRNVRIDTRWAHLGLNDATVEALAKNSGDKRFAYDSYRRFITMYSDVVLGLGHHHFEEILDDHKDRNGYTLDTDLTADDWVGLIGRYKERLEEEHGAPFPQDPHEQLWGAISAVFGSWMNQRAITYRRLYGIPESWGTAVNVQAMVFGNMGETSATGVAFTRNPSTGEKKLYGEFLINAQGEDVVAGIRTPQGLPVTIRLLDPPLHEFLPHSEEEIADVAAAMGADPKKLADRARNLHEFNPMLGFRGCRLAIAYPEIAEMQARAIFEAAVEAAKRTGKPVVPEVMVPLIATKAELDLVKASIDAMAEVVARETGTKVAYQVGTMIELPRASLRAAEIAETAEFFSFGTNNLTQTAFGISRDDAASFLGTYMARGILASDPFVSIDREGVGELVRIGVERGRKTKAKLKIGICGEHGGDPASVAFCHEIALDYVSCSPFRIPIARLAAAQAALGKGPAGEA